MAENIRITLHPLKKDSTIDTDVNLYPKTLIDGIVDREGAPIEVQEKLIAGENIIIQDNTISAVPIDAYTKEESDEKFATIESLSSVQEYVEDNDQILSNNICALYDNTATYEVNDIAMHNNQLFRCTVAITEPEEFNPEHWTSSTIKYNFITKYGDERIGGDKVFDGNITFNGDLYHTEDGYIGMNHSDLDINNSTVQIYNTRVYIGGSPDTGKTYTNILPATFSNTVDFNGSTNFNASPNITSDLNFVGIDNKVKMTFNRDGNLYFKDGTAWSVNIDNDKKIRYANSGQLDLRYGDFRLTNGYSIFWGDKTKNRIWGSGSYLYLGIDNFPLITLNNSGVEFSGSIVARGVIQSFDKMYVYDMGTNDYAVTTKKYVDDIFTRISGYDATKTQVLKHINGTLTWVDE